MAKSVRKNNLCYNEGVAKLRHPVFFTKGVWKLSYQTAVAYLENIGVFGSQLGLARIQALLAALDHPEEKFRSIHVTGTNGKGSTSAMLAFIAKSAGLKTGLYTSPHLESYNERIQVGGEPIGKEAFGEAVEETHAAADKLVAAGVEQPTQFEVLTAAAFLHFARSEVDLAIIEVGLGGLLDSTNVITPLCSVITNVAFEHADRCGGTLEGVIEHKGGIIKHGVPVVTAAEGVARERLRMIAKEKQAPFYCEEECWQVDHISLSRQGTQFQYSGFDKKVDYLLSLVGRHQAHNAGLALTVMQLLLPQLMRRVDMLDAALYQGLRETVWPGRLEAVPNHCDWWIDGAHNPHGAAVLRAALDTLYPGRPITFVLGILADKDRAGILRTLVRKTDRVIVVPVQSERAAAPQLIAREIRTEKAPVAVNDMREGLALAAQETGPVCIAGSLYLIGEVRKYLWLDKQKTNNV